MVRNKSMELELTNLGRTEMKRRAVVERQSGPLQKMRDTVLRALWVGAYIIILQVFHLIQELESQNDRQRASV